jgi:arsenate reductase
MKTTIYHNPRCRKSRETLHLLEEQNIEFEVVKYLEEVPSISKLQKILDLLEMKPIDLIRKNEAIWKENYKGKSLTDEELLEAMHQNPKLIERPIVIHDQKAVIGRPPENILKIIA